MYNNKRIIVSMTSWKKRINNVSKVVYSLYKNSLCPDSIELNLSSDEFINKEQDLPEDLLTLVAANILTINWVKEDTGVFKKFIPVLKKYPNEDFYLFSCDDDWLYNNNFISEMLKRLGNGDYFSLQNPRHVVGNSTVYKSYLNNDAATFKDLVFYNANSQDPKDHITIGSNSHAIKRTSLIYNFFDR